MFLRISTNFTSTLGIPLTSPELETGSIKGSSGVELRDFTLTNQSAYARFTPSIPNNASPLRITAAAGTELAGASSTATVIIFTVERVLQP